MSPASRSKSKDRKASKELQKASSKPLSHPIAASNTPVNGCTPLLGKFHMLDPTQTSFASPLQVSGRFRNIDETDDQSGNTIGTGMEYETGSNNGSCSGESEDHKEKTPHNLIRQEVVPGADNEKREKIRQKNERKHQRQKERRAQELHERCSGFLMSRKLEALSQKLVAMGFSSERATMALILNEGKIEESVAWLFDGGEEADEQKENNLDGGNLKIDISEELARIADMEIRYSCLRQEVERAVVACEGDLEKAAETLRVQKQDQPSAPPKPEETGDPPTVSNSRLSGSASQNLSRSHPKSASTTIQQKRDEKDFNYTKTAATVGAPVELGSKNVQTSRKVQPKLEWAKPQLGAAVPTDKRWPSAAGTTSISYSLASPLQETPPAAKTESRYVALGSELKNLQLGSVKEPVLVMQRPLSANAKPTSKTLVAIPREMDLQDNNAGKFDARRPTKIKFDYDDEDDALDESCSNLDDDALMCDPDDSFLAADKTSADYYFDSYSHFGIHEEMLKDVVRTKTYQNVIYKNTFLFKDKIVLDVGAGTGILSLFCAKAGAKHVYAVECSHMADMAQEIVKENGFSDVITVLKGKVEEIELPVTQVDVIISEWMGYFLLFENMLNTVLYARDKWLGNSGVVLPDKASLYLTAIEDAEYKEDKIEFWNNVYGFDMSCIKKQAMIEPLVDTVDQKQVVTNCQLLKTMDISKMATGDASFTASFKLVAERDDYIHALVAYFDVAFTKCHKLTGFSTGPRSRATHWKQTVLYLEDVLTICEGEALVGSMTVAQNKKNPRDVDILVKYSLNGRRCVVSRSQHYRMR